MLRTRPFAVPPEMTSRKDNEEEEVGFDDSL